MRVLLSSLRSCAWCDRLFVSGSVVNERFCCADQLRQLRNHANHLWLEMVKKKSNGALKRSRNVKKKLPKANSALKKKTPPKASALSAEPMDEMDLLSEALSKSLKTKEAPTEIDMGKSTSRAISKKKHNRARRAAKRKVVKVKANSLAQRARRRGIARN